MPIHEKDPWREQYFINVECPPEVFIPTDDMDAYCWNPAHRWLYNKLSIAESQGLDCAPHGIEPKCYPVFSKPIYNLKGMGVGSRTLHSIADYHLHESPGHMWMTLLTGEHVSTDVAVINGEMVWSRHSVGLAKFGGIFDYWIIEAGRRPDLEAYCAHWIKSFLSGYTGMLNLESIGGRIIETHLRFSDQWPDLYGSRWLDAVVGLYTRGIWEYADNNRRTGYSVILFGPHVRQYLHPPAMLVQEIRGMADISSTQITFHPDKLSAAHSMPPGGFRLAIVNTWQLSAGQQAREFLARFYDVEMADR